jgi:hypothetical protein
MTIIPEGKIFTFILFLISFASLIVGQILSERGIRKPKIRKPRGLDSLDDAIARAKEMGRPILYAGLNYNLRRPSNIASLNILGYVARETAKIDVPLHVGVMTSEALPVVLDICETSAYAVGKPLWFDPNNVMWWSDQFVAMEHGLVKHASATKPAAFFDFGHIQDENIVVPVFLMSQGIDCFCMTGTGQLVYSASTLIGTDDWFLTEELYAASAYVTESAQAVGGIMGADWLKIAIWLMFVVGSIISLAGSSIFINILEL